MRSGALGRFTVLDLTRVRGGPAAVRQLLDWGARVVRIESPVDDNLGGPRDGSDFQNLHRGKRALVLDLKHPDGRAAFERLVRQADVVVENYRPGVKHRLGIDYERLREVNPRIVYASISGFGQTGPYADRPGYDQIAQGMGGLMSVTGLPGQGPVRAGIPVADLGAGLYCAFGILAALHEREVSGEGQWVHTSLLETQLALLDVQAARWLVDGEVPGQAGNDHPTSVTTGVFECADGPINVGASGGDIYARFCRAIGAPHLLDDPRFATEDDCTANRAAFRAAVDPIMARATAASWIERLNDAGVPAGPIYRVDEAFADPHVRSLGLVASVEHPRRGRIDLVGQPITMSRSRWHLDGPAPEHGQHGAEVLAAFGFSAEEIEDLRGKGVTR